MRDNVVTRKLAKLALMALLALSAATGTAFEEFKPNDLPAAAGVCKQAISQSRMICLTGANCQKEIGAVLRACDASPAACAAARYDLRTHCGKELPFDGSRECEGALRQVGRYCEER